jgi:hypothetical protein
MLKPGKEIINFCNFSKRNGTEKLNFLEKKIFISHLLNKEKNFSRRKFLFRGLGQKNLFFPDGNFRSVRTKSHILGINLKCKKLVKRN